MKDFKKFIAKTVLYISAFIPMYILIILKTVIEIINANLSFNFLNTFMLVFLFVLILTGGAGVFFIMRKGKKAQNYIIVKTVNNITDQHFLSYFSLFVLFALSFNLELFSMAMVFIIIILMIGYVYIKNNLFYINPFLNLLGYSFYDITYTDGKSEDVLECKVFFKGKLNVNKNVTLVRYASSSIIFAIEK